MTSRVPVEALAEIVMFAVSWVAETKVVEFTVMPVPNVAVAPFTKLVPFTVTFWLVAPCPRDAGLVEVTVGRAFTLKQPVQVAVPWSVLVTVTFRAPVVAFPAIVIVAVMFVGVTTLLEFTVIPVPEKPTVAPFAKFVPTTVIVCVTPCGSEEGFVEVTVGAAFTVKQPVQVPVP